MLYDIQRFESPNCESRDGFKPIMIVNHITDGESAVRRDDNHENTAVYNTFMNRNCKASSNYVIQRDGKIQQYVDIRHAAWTQGLHDPNDFKAAISPIVRQMKVNPNLYCVSKEYIAYSGAGGDGSITDAQFRAGQWLDKYIQAEVKKLYGHTIQLNSSFVIGHCHVDPRRKPFCPGRNFPWARVYQELAISDPMTLEDYEGRLQYLGSDQHKVTQAFSIANEVFYLYNLAQVSDGRGIWAKQILLRLHPIMVGYELMKKPFDPEKSHEDVYNEVLYQFNTGQQKNGQGVWAREQLLKLYPYMLSQGLVPTA